MGKTKRSKEATRAVSRGKLAVMKETNVITCFLEHDGKILILKRSDLVGSFRGHWAGVSGYMETDSTEQAYTEIGEELGLSRDDVELLVEGPVLSVESKEKDTTWHVHLFLFHLPDPARIRLDWEHTEWRLIYPSDLGEFQTVPKLKDGLDLVLGEADAHFQTDDPDIRIWMVLFARDESHGASWFSTQAVNLLERQLQKLPEPDPEEFLGWLEDFCRAVGRIRPSMLSIANRLYLIHHRIREEWAGGNSNPRFRSAALEAIGKEKAQNEEDRGRLAEQFLPHLPSGGTLLTFSYSHTVLDVLKKFPDRIGKVIVTESRPLCEGARMARELSRAGIKTVFVTDASFGVFLKECDLVVTGCDMMVRLPGGNGGGDPGLGWIVNKIGTYPIAVLAKHEGIPFVTICERYKLIHPDLVPDTMVLEEKDPSEVISGDHPFSVRNVYFDKTPIDLVTLITP